MITTLPSTMTGRHVRHAIGLADLEAHIRALIAVEPTPGVPLISCYTNFSPSLAQANCAINLPAAVGLSVSRS